MLSSCLWGNIYILKPSSWTVKTAPGSVPHGGVVGRQPCPRVVEMIRVLYGGISTGASLCQSQQQWPCTYINKKKVYLYICSNWLIILWQAVTSSHEYPRSITRSSRFWRRPCQFSIYLLFLELYIDTLEIRSQYRQVNTVCNIFFFWHVDFFVRTFQLSHSTVTGKVNAFTARRFSVSSGTCQSYVLLGENSQLLMSLGVFF